MRKIIWLFIIALWLVPIGFIGLSYLSAPPEDEYNSYKSYMAIIQQYVDDKQIDKSVITGTREDDNYTRIYADYVTIVQSLNRRLAKEKNFLLILVQPRSLASGQSADVSLEKVADFERKIAEVATEREAAIADMLAKMEKLDKKKLKVFDVVSFIEGLDTERAERTQELQEYLGLSQYVKALLEFVKSRAGYYTLSQDGKTLQFSTPEDQAYYTQVADGINKYVRSIDDKIAKRTADDRKNLNALISK